MPKTTLKSNRNSNSQGKNISIYLRAEHFKTLELLRKGLDINNNSRVIQHLLEVCQKMIESFMKQNPEIVWSLLVEQQQKAMVNLQKQFKHT